MKKKNNTRPNTSPKGYKKIVSVWLSQLDTYINDINNYYHYGFYGVFIIFSNLLVYNI